MPKKILIVFAIVLISFAAQAKLPQKIFEAVEKNYPPAIKHNALETAFENPDPSKMRGYVVVLKGGIPVERARYFISWDVYDYRGAEIHLEKNGEITTRSGAAYAYLQPGDVMAVTEIKDFGSTVYLKLMSSNIYIPETRKEDKHHSRVTCMLGFKFPKDVFKTDNADEVIKSMGEWLKPFSSLQEAQAYAKTMGAVSPVAEKFSEPSVQNKNVTDDQLKNLEKKIDDAKRQMEEAEKEMKALKGQGQKK